MEFNHLSGLLLDYNDYHTGRMSCMEPVYLTPVLCFHYFVICVLFHDYWFADLPSDVFLLLWYLRLYWSFWLCFMEPNIIYMTTSISRRLNILCIKFNISTLWSLQQRWSPSYMWVLAVYWHVEHTCMASPFQKDGTGAWY